MWLEGRRTAGKVSELTIKNYEARLKQIEPYLGKKRLNWVAGQANGVGMACQFGPTPDGVGLALRF